MIFGRQSSLHEPLDLNSTFIASDEPLYCPEDSYKTFIISREPLMIYIEGFLKGNESNHLVDVRCVTGPPRQSLKKTIDGE